MVESNSETTRCPSRVFWVGIGCKRDTPKAIIEQAIQEVFRAHQLAESAIAGIATIDTKANEMGLVEFCRDRHLPLRWFPADVLRSVEIPNPSGAIAALIGTPSVAEAAAFLASWEAREEKPNLCVSKQIFRNLGQTGSVTVAVARSPNFPLHPPLMTFCSQPANSIRSVCKRIVRLNQLFWKPM